MITPEEILELRRYLQSITERPAPIDSQPHKREGIFIWCEDWEIIELCKYLFNGRDAYFGDPPPRRLAFNPLWSKEKIAEQAENLLKEHGTIAKIIESFKARRSYDWAV